MTPLRRGRVSAALFAMAASAAFAAPASAAPATVTVDNDSFGPTAVTINAGESVTWDFKESSHNAYSDDGWSVNKSFGTGTFSKTFDAEGTYRYYCQAHPGMKGTVKVAAAPQAAPAPAPAAQPTGQPTAGAAATAPAAWSFPAAEDLRAPVVSSLRATMPRKSRKPKLSVRLSEAATVVVGVRRVMAVARASAAMPAVRLKGRRGVNRFNLNLRGVRAGRYKLRIVAVDAAGNESPVRIATLRVAR